LGVERGKGRKKLGRAQTARGEGAGTYPSLPSAVKTTKRSVTQKGKKRARKCKGRLSKKKGLDK